LYSKKINSQRRKFHLRSESSGRLAFYTARGRVGDSRDFAEGLVKGYGHAGSQPGGIKNDSRAASVLSLAGIASGVKQAQVDTENDKSSGIAGGIGQANSLSYIALRGARRTMVRAVCSMWLVVLIETISTAVGLLNSRQPDSS
jgi:hypothetical protein